MPLTFKVGAYLPHAVKKEQIVPRNLVRIGAKPPNGVLPALRGTLSFQGKEYPFEAHLRRTAEVRTDGKHRFLIQCRQAVKKTNFTVTLDRSWQVTDPGSERAAEYHSRITVKPGINGEKDGSKHHLFMNHTLDYAGYRFFQSGFEPTPFEVDGRLANVSTLSVAQDPGLWFKYAGTLIVVLGIAIMFYMKAYFFKSRGKTPVEEQAGAIQ